MVIQLQQSQLNLDYKIQWTFDNSAYINRLTELHNFLLSSHNSMLISIFFSFMYFWYIFLAVHHFFYVVVLQFWYVHIEFSYLIASMGLQLLWSFGLACLDLHALRSKRNLQNPVLVSLFVVGDWVNLFLLLFCLFLNLYIHTYIYGHTLITDRMEVEQLLQQLKEK